MPGTCKVYWSCYLGCKDPEDHEMLVALYANDDEGLIIIEDLEMED